MSTEPKWASSPKPWLARCAVHQTLEASSLTITLRKLYLPSALLGTAIRFRTGRKVAGNLYAWRHQGGPSGGSEPKAPRR